jgi:hypothetical protein
MEEPPDPELSQPTAPNAITKRARARTGAVCRFEPGREAVEDISEQDISYRRLMWSEEEKGNGD